MKRAWNRYGVKARAVSVLICILGAVLLPGLHAAGAAELSPADVDRLVQSALEQGLYRDRYWQILLHYQDTPCGVKSQVDDPDFFLAETGKTDPAAELAATIRHLFSSDAPAEEDAGCPFYARYVWLRQKLQVPDSVPGRTCPSIDGIVPRSASLIFPTAYMNNPASMFGHTLLTLDTGYDNKRLASAVNYAAHTGGRTGIFYAISGLLGFYKGYFSVMPYYEKIEQYSDVNQRDIWEYRLNLTPDEIRRMIRHIREMDGVYTDYYFFDENCSYNLLYLIEAARPSVHLTDRTKPIVLPVDTIKAIDQAGLIESVAFRPAKATRITYQIDQMKPAEMQTALSIINGTSEPQAMLDASIDRENAIRILDLAAEQIQYQFVKESIDKPTYRQRILSVLKARSKLGQSEAQADMEIPPPPRPEIGHDTTRMSIAGGADNGDALIELRFRPGFTDLLDMDYMHHQGAQIEYGDFRARYYPEEGRIALERADVIDIVSIAPRDAFFKPYSWKFTTGWARKPMRDGEDALYYHVDGGLGLGVDAGYAGLCYAMMEAEGNLGGALEENFALGGGLSAGSLITVLPSWKAHLSTRAMRFVAGDRHAVYGASLTNNFKVARNHHMSVEADWEKSHAKSVWQAQLVWHLFF